MRRLWLWFLARFRLSESAVCLMSEGRHPWNCYHDYPDADPPEPAHFCMLKCRRCGKEFTI